MIGTKIEINEIMTTNMSRTLAGSRQKAPGWNNKPYDISLSSNSIVNIVVKK